MKCALLALLLAAPIEVASKPAPLAVTPASPDAAIIVRLPHLPVPYRFSLAAFDPAAEALPGAFGAGWVPFDVRAGPGGDELFARRIKPGTYVVRDVAQQTQWTVCFAAETRQITVRAGEVVYLGAFDALTPITELHANVASHPGHERTRQGGIRAYVENITPPALTIDAAGLAAAAAWLKTNAPATSVAPVAATPAAARFKTGYDIVGQRTCGGNLKLDFVAPRAGRTGSRGA